MKVREGYKMTEFGLIPNEWDIRKFENIVEKITDGTHKTPVYTDNGVPFLRVTDIQDSCIDWNNVKYISKEEHTDLIRRCKPEKGDILYSKNGTIGIPKIVDWDKEFSIFVSLCLIKIKKNGSEVFNKFLESFLASDCCLNQIKMRAKQGTVTNLHLEEIRELLIPLPPIPEQQRIAEILSSNDTLISKTAELIEKTKEVKQGLMQELLTKGIGHTEFKESELGRIPKEWVIKPLSNVTDYVDYRGKTPAKSDDGMFLITAKNIKQGFIDYDCSKEYVLFSEYEQIMKRGKPQIGDVLITTEAPCGNVAQIDKTDIALAQRVIKYRGYEDCLDNTFLKYYLLGDSFQSRLIYLSTGGTVKGIKGSILHQMLLLLPSLEEQNEIATILSSVDKKLQTLTKRKQQLEEIKQGLMQDLLTGRVRVNLN